MDTRPLTTVAVVLLQLMTSLALEDYQVVVQVMVQVQVVAH